jgi:hypothetical protein
MKALCSEQQPAEQDKTSRKDMLVQIARQRMILWSEPLKAAPKGYMMVMDACFGEDCAQLHGMPTMEGSE